MPYLGNDLQVAQPSYRNIDDISGSFNSSTTSFPLLVSGSAPVPFPINSNQCLISVAGVVQRPDDSGTEGFRISGGNIIFSSAPSTGADFFGVILAGADYVNVGANFPSGSAAAPSITFDSDLDTGIYNSAANQVSVSTAGSERLRIDSAGQVEVVSLGTASAPAFSFTSDSNTGIYSPGADQVAISTNGTGRLFVDASGRIGVGRTPVAYGSYNVLDLAGSAGSIQKWVHTGSTVELQAYASATLTAIGSATNHPFVIVTNDTERLRITSAGLVGVGTSSPLALLDVRGNVYMTGNGTSRQTTAVVNTGGAFESGVESSTGASVFTGSTAYASVIGSQNSTPLQFGTNGAIRATLDTSGRLGIGTTSPARQLTLYSSTSPVLQLVNSTTGDTANDGCLLYESGANFIIENQEAGEIRLLNNGSQRATIDSSGRLLVGASSSPSGGQGQYARLVVQGYTGDGTAEGIFAIQRGQGATSILSQGDIGRIIFNDNVGNTFAGIYCFADATPGTNDYPGRLVFSTTADGASSPTERMRITNNGFVWINRTTAPQTVNSLLAIDGASTNLCAIFNRDVSDDSLRFTRSNTLVGSISVTTTATAYNTSSDYRLKENVTPVTDSITRLQQLKPSRFNFIADPDKTVDGFLAHEAAEVVPECVTGEKDAVDDDGNPVYQGIDQSKLVPLLTAALQEAIGRIESLEQRLDHAGINWY